MLRLQCLLLCAALVSAAAAPADDSPSRDTSHGDALLTEYFSQQVAQIEGTTFADIHSLEDWGQKRGEYRRQLAEMLGLDPMPEKTPLEPEITGTIDHEKFTVENLNFQSSPGLYVTGNLYVPKGLEGPAPTILYVCGHARVKEGDVSYGNKTAYHHHAVWFASHGYVCLAIDTLQLGEIEGLHHGTYREGMWWWHSRGYTPAGVEAWNCIRALDYLETRPEVDAKRFGVTGRSGGGAYSWWIAALDERIQCAVPVAGICTLRNHLLGPFQTSSWSSGETRGHDGCIEGHCDCMFFHNTYRWSFPMVAALVAPRPLLISNTDKDRIFPLDGVYEVYVQTQKIYDLYGATDKLGLQITEGPHKDTQQLRVHAFQWMNRHLKGEEPLIQQAAEKIFEPQQLRVFEELPEDERNTSIQETFVPAAEEQGVPVSETQWESLRETWMTALHEQIFGGWPDEDETPPLDVQRTFSQERDDIHLNVYEFTSQQPYRLQMYVVTRGSSDLQQAESVHLQVLTEDRWSDVVSLLRSLVPEFEADSGINPSPAGDFARSLIQQPRGNPALVFLVPRGVGPTAWTDHPSEQVHIKRRLALLGQTLDGMRTWDVLRGLQALKELSGDSTPVVIGEASGVAASWLLAASIFEDSLKELMLSDYASAESPAIFLNADRLLPPSALLLLAAPDSNIGVWTSHPEDFETAVEAARQPWFERRLEVKQAASR